VNATAMREVRKKSNGDAPMAWLPQDKVTKKVILFP